MLTAKGGSRAHDTQSLPECGKNSRNGAPDMQPCARVCLTALCPQHSLYPFTLTSVATPRYGQHCTRWLECRCESSDKWNEQNTRTLLHGTVRVSPHAVVVAVTRGSAIPAPLGTVPSSLPTAVPAALRSTVTTALGATTVAP